MVILERVSRDLGILAEYLSYTAIKRDIGINSDEALRLAQGFSGVALHINGTLDVKGADDIHAAAQIAVSRLPKEDSGK